MSGQGRSHIGPFMNNTCIGAFGGISDGEATMTVAGGSVGSGYNHSYTNLTLEEAQSMSFELRYLGSHVGQPRNDEMLQMIRELLSFE